jgi:hypothetical protein
LSCKKLLCGLCHAFQWKTHGKAIAVRFLAFVVRPERTAKAEFPVVVYQYHMHNLIRILACY